MRFCFRPARQQCPVIAGDTIVALASAPGQSRAALIRVSGPGARALADELAPGRFSRGCRPGRLCLGTPASLPVPLLVHGYPAPTSYTGEDVVELEIPGNPSLVERVLGALCARGGVRLAQPGEFSARAYLAGKMTIAQAEGVAAAIAATSAEQLDAARELATGRAGRACLALADECAAILALVEAGIDFVDQDGVVPIAPQDLVGRLARLREAIRGRLGAAEGCEVPAALARVALVGRPNAGKSTLFNALLGRARALTSPRAGTTRDVLEEQLDLSRDAPGAGCVVLMDLPGLDASARGEVDAGAQAAARAALDRADALIWCDPSGRFEGDGAGPIPKSGRGGAGTLRATPVVRVRTLADRPAPGSPQGLAVCALDGWNLGVLRRAIADAACRTPAPAGATLAALLPRHRLALARAYAALGEARALPDPDAACLDAPEAVASWLREALDALGELSGRLGPDEILGRIFSTFCVGK